MQKTGDTLTSLEIETVPTLPLILSLHISLYGVSQDFIQNGTAQEEILGKHLFSAP